LFDGIAPVEVVCDACLVGAVAQLGERLVRNEEVSGSIPLSSTIEEITCEIPAFFPDKSSFSGL
jgi:hypothetical protein